MSLARVAAAADFHRAAVALGALLSVTGPVRETCETCGRGLLPYGEGLRCVDCAGAEPTPGLYAALEAFRAAARTFRLYDDGRTAP